MIVAGIATIPSRINEVKRTIESLLPQVDRINIALNNFTGYPTEVLNFDVESQKKIWFYTTQGSDERKFSEVCGDIYLSCDDDLIFPPDYVNVIKAKLEQYDIVTFHGRNFNSFPIQSYYKSPGSKYRCLDKVSHDIPVQFGGTGCMAFKPAKFSVTLNDFPTKYMADIHFAIAAKKAGKQIMCIAHEAGWIKYQPVSNTIYDRFRDSDAEQTARVNLFFSKQLV